jgi:bacterioferritin
MTAHTTTPIRDAKSLTTAEQETDFTSEGAPAPKVRTPAAPAFSLPKVEPSLVLNLKALEEARHDLDQGAVTPHYGPWRLDIIRLLNDALATELVCALRYRRHHYTAEGLSSARIAEEFLVHSNEEGAHADLLAARIVELGGMPDFSPDTLSQRSHAAYDDTPDLKGMIRANLVAERVAIESYSQMILLIGDKDSTTRRIVEKILGVEQKHAEELRDWLAD